MCNGLEGGSDEYVLGKPTERVRMNNSGALRWCSVGRVCVNDFMTLYHPQLLLPMVLSRGVLPAVLQGGVAEQ
jgi:hypothetical protein